MSKFTSDDITPTGTNYSLFSATSTPLARSLAEMLDRTPENVRDYYPDHILLDLTADVVDSILQDPGYFRDFKINRNLTQGQPDFFYHTIFARPRQNMLLHAHIVGFASELDSKYYRDPKNICVQVQYAFFSHKDALALYEVGPKTEPTCWAN